MSLFGKNGRKEKENNDMLGELTPGREFIKDLKDLGVKKYIYAIITAILSVFLSGLSYQSLRFLLSGKTIYILSSFKYGIFKTHIISLVFFILFLVAGYRVYRSLKRNFLVNYKDNYYTSKKNTYGSSHFQTEEEMTVPNDSGYARFNKYKSIEETTGHVFGTNKAGDIFTFNYPPGMNFNKIYFGAPGSAKSAAVVKTDLYQAIRRGDSLVVTDSKGDLYAQTSAIAREKGYIVRVFNLKASEFRNSDSFNLFETLKADDPTLDAKADIIATSIINNTTNPSKKDDYWDKNEFNLYKCVSMYIATNPAYIKAGRNNLPELLNFLSTHKPADLKAIFETIPEGNPIRTCYDIFADCEERNQGQIINGASIRLTKLTNQYLQKALSFNEIDPVLPMKRKCLYYVIISDTDDSYKFISALFFSSLFTEQCNYSDRLTSEEKKQQKTVHYILDEYRATGGVYALPIKIATLRSRKIGITIILQDIGQLRSMYEEGEVSTILNCCTVKGLLSTNDIATAEYFKILLGQQTILQESNRYEESTADIVHAHGVTAKSYSEGKRDLLSLEEMLNGVLERDEILYVISGMPPVRLRKYFSEKSGERIHPLEIAGANIGERKPHLHKPLWRKRMEDEQKAQEMAAEQAAQEAQNKASQYADDQEESSPDQNITDAEETDKANEAKKDTTSPKAKPQKTNRYSQVEITPLENGNINWDEDDII